MSERRVWTEEEDNAMRDIIIGMKITKWSEVAKLMLSKYAIQGRTGKQCRERWHNQLDPNINLSAWSAQQERRLFELHQQHGNKWARIAEQLPGRSDNSIKNYFYSTLRRGLRRLNKFIADQREQLKSRQIKSALLHKIIELSGFVGAKKQPPNYQLIGRCFPLIDKLVQCSKEESFTRSNYPRLKSLITDLTQFDRSLVRRKYTKRNKSTNLVDEEQEQSESQPQDNQDPEILAEPQAERPPFASQQVQAPIKRTATNNSSSSIVRRGSLLLGTERSRSGRFEEDPVNFESPPNNRQFLTSSFESLSVYGMAGFQKIASDPDMGWTLFNPTNPAVSVDQSQASNILSGGKQPPEQEGGSPPMRTTTASDVLVLSKYRRRPTLDCSK